MIRKIATVWSNHKHINPGLIWDFVRWWVNKSDGVPGASQIVCVDFTRRPKFRMHFKETHPFDGALKKTEIATGMRAAPLQIRRHSDATILQDSYYARMVNARFFQRVDRFDIGLCADIAGTIFICADAHVTDD